MLNTHNFIKKVADSTFDVGDVEKKMSANPGLVVRYDLCNHPKLVATASHLGVDDCYLQGYLTRMWLRALAHAEDGDLWRGNEESTIRYICALASYRGNMELLTQFVAILQQNGWLDGWRLHEWPEHAGPSLINKHKTSNPHRLVEIWTQYGMVYGRRGTETDDAGREKQKRKQTRSNEEVKRKSEGSKPENATYPINNPKPYKPCIETKALSPPAQEEKKDKKALRGGMGEIATAAGIVKTAEKNGLLFDFSPQGLRVQGLTPAHCPWSTITVEDIYAAFFKLIRFHGIATTKQLMEKIRHCGVSPGEWAAMFLDKIHAVYREREGGTLIDTESADPVALTIAGLKPKNGNVRHTHTEAAANLLLEILADWEVGQKDGKTHWGRKLSGPTIAFELDRRKGKRGKIQKE